MATRGLAGIGFFTGAGFTAGGVPQTDTDNADNVAVPEWYGIGIDAGVNDRNVAFIPENEPFGIWELKASLGEDVACPISRV